VTGYAAGVQRASVSLWETAALVALTFAALVTVGAQLAGHGLAGTVAGEVLCVIVPTVVFVRVRRVPPGELGLGRVPALATVGGALFGSGAFYLLAVALHAWIERVWPTPPDVREAMERLVIPAAGARPLVIDLLALALVPAAAEELLFRGVLFGAVRPRLGATGAVIVTALAFGLYHGSIYRFAPAAFAGILLGLVRAASGSLWPALAFHLANNAAVIVAMHLGYATPPATVAALAIASAATALGSMLVARRGQSVLRSGA
jgi:sodium transport system permease protein